MLTKRIIPCLDVKDGKVVKGVNFVNLSDIGYPPDLAEEYSKQGADEVTFLDICATVESRKTMLDLVQETAKKVFVPLCVGGGIRTAEDVRNALAAGADKVSINSAAVANPEIITECSEDFGKQCIVVAIDVKKNKQGVYEVVTHGGTKFTGIDALGWAQKCQDLGAGELLVTSMDCDGVKNGYDLEITGAIADEVSIPVIASGGCGSVEHIYEAFAKTKVSAALAASIFHYKQYTVGEVKQYLRDRGIVVR